MSTFKTLISPRGKKEEQKGELEKAEVPPLKSAPQNKSIFEYLKSPRRTSLNPKLFQPLSSIKNLTSSPKPILIETNTPTEDEEILSPRTLLSNHKKNTKTNNIDLSMYTVNFDQVLEIKELKKMFFKFLEYSSFFFKISKK
jgi:hypothetical protein